MAAFVFVPHSLRHTQFVIYHSCLVSFIFFSLLSINRQIFLAWKFFIYVFFRLLFCFFFKFFSSIAVIIDIAPISISLGLRIHVLCEFLLCCIDYFEMKKWKKSDKNVSLRSKYRSHHHYYYTFYILHTYYRHHNNKIISLLNKNAQHSYTVWCSEEFVRKTKRFFNERNLKTTRKILIIDNIAQK